MGNTVQVIFALLITAAIVNVLVNGQNTASVINAGGGQVNSILGTLTSNR